MDKQTFDLDSIKLKETKVIRDAIHDYIPIEHIVIWKLINTPEMQRLRRIKQLGGTYQVFQSAEHSRFVHSLGVYHIIRIMLENEYLKEELTDYDKLCVMCAGLLHDIGHGPFSHSFEGVFHKNHEEMTIDIIRSDTHVNQILKDVHPDLANDVASIIAHTHPNKILIQMVSSQLDADRMDYLLRDSYMTGTTYGHFDMSRLLRTLRIVNGRIVYKESGVQAIENYILARYHMYWQVYYHSTTRSYEHLLKVIFLRIKDLYIDGYTFQTNMKYLLPFLNNKVSIQDYLMLDETIIMYYFREFTMETDSILKDLSSKFLNRQLFKNRILKDIEELHKIEEISNKHGYNPRYYIMSDYTKQVPYLHYGEDEELEEIEILSQDGLLYPLPSKSEIVSAILNSKKYKSENRVFYPKELKNELSIL